MKKTEAANPINDELAQKVMAKLQAEKDVTNNLEVQFSSGGLSFKSIKPVADLTPAEKEAFSDATVLCEDGIPTPFFQRLLSVWPMKFWEGAVAEITSMWITEGGGKVDFDKQTGKLVFHTNHIEANEILVACLVANDSFWKSFWESSHRDGSLVFNTKLPLQTE